MTGTPVGHHCVRGLGRQSLAHAEVDGAPDDTSSLPPQWNIGIFHAPKEVETDTPVAVLTAITVHAGGQRLRAAHLGMVEADRPSQQGDGSDDELRSEIMHACGAALWRTACVAVRQLAAVAEIDNLDLPSSPPEPGTLQVRTDDDEPSDADSTPTGDGA